MSPITCRSVLEGAGGALLAASGCLSLSDGRPEVTVSNDRTETVTAAVAVLRPEDGATVRSDSLRIDPDGTRRWQLDLDNTPHRITIDVEGGPRSSFEWTPGEEFCCVGAEITGSGIEFRGRAY